MADIDPEARKIPGSRYYRAHCSECRVLMRVTLSDLFREDTCCESCRGLGGVKLPSLGVGRQGNSTIKDKLK